jgi:hypothetical protein
MFATHRHSYYFELLWWLVLMTLAAMLTIVGLSNVPVH